MKVWTVPNAISYLRLVILLPLSLGLIAAGYYGWALLSMVLMGASDWLDGMLARRLNQTSEIGRELDPAADRAAITLSAVALVLAGILPWQMFAILVFVDTALFILAFVWFSGYPPTTVTFMGKLRTALLLVALPVLLLSAALDSETLRIVALGLVGAGVAGHALAGWSYFTQMRAALKQKRAATAPIRDVA